MSIKNRTVLISACGVGLYGLHRWALTHTLALDGLTTLGPENYDSFYPYAQARALFREGGFLFHNVWGSLDAEPRLFSPVALVFSFLLPVFRWNIFVFDIFLTSTFLALSIVFLVSTFPWIKTWQWMVVFLGGGTIYVFGTIFDWNLELVESNFWGLTFLTNMNSSLEVFYHSIFYGVLYLVSRGKWTNAACWGALLVWLHPFNGSPLIVSLVVAQLWRLRDQAKFSLQTGVNLMILVLAGLSSWFCYSFFLPSFSEDANFLHKIYHGFSFAVPPWEYLLSYLPAVTVITLLSGFLICVRVRGGSRSSQAKWNSTTALLFVVAGTCMFCVVGAFLGLPIPQPAHWTRVYPHLALWILAFTLLNSVRTNAFLRLLVAACSLISIVDTGLFARWYHENFAKWKSGIASSNDEALLKRLETLQGGRFLELKTCESALRPTSFQMSYLVSVLTDHQVFVGHTYFSPFVGYFLKPQSWCGSGLVATIQKFDAEVLLGPCALGPEVVPVGFKEDFKSEPNCIWRRQDQS